MNIVFVLPSRASYKGEKEGIPASLIRCDVLRGFIISTRHVGITELVEDILKQKGDKDR